MSVFLYRNNKLTKRTYSQILVLFIYLFQLKNYTKELGIFLWHFASYECYFALRNFFVIESVNEFTMKKPL